MSSHSCPRLIRLVVSIGIIFIFTFETTQAGELSSSINRFGLELFRKVVNATDSDSNVCISPLSASYALTITYNGAAGKTREDMSTALALSGMSPDEVNQAYLKLTSRLTKEDKATIMEIANSIWYRTGLAVKADFTALCQNKFDALVREMDFSSPEAAEIINKWVADNTRDKIKSIIDPPIDPDIVMMLINAIYFKAVWQNPFDPQRTGPAPFTLPDRSRTECMMMNKIDAFDYYSNDLFQAIELPFGNGRFAMTVLLPDQSITADDLIAKMDDKTMSEWFANFEETSIILHLPRFKFSSDFGLNNMLKKMGMEIAFTGKADFSNMVDDRIWIDSVIHKTFIQVDEQGAEAAAATAVIMKKSFIPSMVVDRPFLLLIREVDSGAIMFIAKVVNPVWEEDER